MVSGSGTRQSEHGGREEHGLIIWVGDEETYSLIAQGGVSCLRGGGCVGVEERQRNQQDGREAGNGNKAHDMRLCLSLVRRGPQLGRFFQSRKEELEVGSNSAASAQSLY